MKTDIRMHQRTTSLAARVLLSLAGAFGGFVLAPAMADLPTPDSGGGTNYVSSSTMTLSGGIWIVEGDVIVSERIIVGSSASVTLHLNEGATLNAQKGINVSSGRTLTIEGSGMLNARGSDGWAGIGGTTSAGTIIINGGTINATGSVKAVGDLRRYGAAIGCGARGSGGSVTINGGQVTAIGVDGGAGIGGDGMTVTLGWTDADDFIDTTSFQGAVGFAAGKGFYYADTEETVTSSNLRGGRLLPLPDTFKSIGVSIVGNGSVTSDLPLAKAGDIVTLTVNSPYPWEFDSLTVETATGSPVDVERIDRMIFRFVMPDEAVVVRSVFAELSPVELTTSEGLKSCLPVVPYQPSFDAAISEWYAVTEDVTLPERLDVTGNVKLYLCASATLTCVKGLRVEGGNGLTIEGDGAMVAMSYSPTGADADAAIGSDEYESCGDITIRGGTISATGSTFAAAIGSGYLGNGGSVTISGGQVTAIGGVSSPGIGSSYKVSVTNTAITLGWTEDDDFIECSGYNGPVSFVEGKEFLRADNRQHATTDNISGVRIIPKLSAAHDITLNSTGDGVLSASEPSAVKDALVTLSWTAADRYIIPTTLTVKDSQGQDIAVEWTSLSSASFVMPDEAVTVAAVFEDMGYVAVTTSDGTVKNCRPITQFLSFGEYGAGSYAVTEDTMIGDRVVIGGDVLLYLCEGTTLTCGSGITVDGENRLTVEGGGSLVADARGYNYGYAAGIGGGYYGDNTGMITINGGRVTAYGGEDAAGIGCGSYGSGGTITINGGTVHATGGSYGAGIGGGFFGSGGTLAINGGTVHATGGRFGAGLGGGQSCIVGTIAINGGQVTATGGEYGVGIGRGYNGTGGSVTLGWTDAEDFIHASSYAADVTFKPDTYFVLQGTGELATPGNIGGNTIMPFTGGTYAITENPGAYGRIDAVYADGADPAIGTIEAPEGMTVHVRCSILDAYYYEREVTGLTVTGSGGEAVAVTALGDGAFQFTMPAEDVTLTPQTPAIVYYDVRLVRDGRGEFKTIQRAFNDSEPQDVVYSGTATEALSQARAGDTVQLSLNATPPYCPYGITVTTGNGESVTVTKLSDFEYKFEMPDDAITVTIQTEEIETVVKTTSEGEQTCLVPRTFIHDWTQYAKAKGVYWFATTEDMTIPHTIHVESRVHVRLYLSEGTTLVCPGIYVEKGSTLTIEGEGTLFADATGAVPNEDPYAEAFHAGIGGGGNIIIKGGDITAKGGDEGAGIGGDIAWHGSGTAGFSGDITILGGTIHAIGGMAAAGIGSSNQENCGMITINGDTVDAVGGWRAAGIGGGLWAPGGDIRISGGVVNASGGGSGAGIGGGFGGTGGKIAISGGVVTARGGVDYGYGAGIGEGSYAANGTSTVIRITGGQITARGGCQDGDIIGGVLQYRYSAGIGLAWNSQVSECDIALGWTKKSDYVDSDLYDGDVAFAEGKPFKLDGTDTLATPENINGVRIVPMLTGLDLLEGEGTGDEPWLIRSEEDWRNLCEGILDGETTSGKFFRMTADIGPVTDMAGGAGHPFAGTFDGGGHTLTADIESTDVWAAPFGFVNGATISNLTVTGTVTGGGIHAGGLVGACAGGPNVLRDCTVAVDVSVADGIGYAGGIVGQGGDSTLSFEGCIFSGSVSGFDAFAGGLLGWGSSMTLSIADCLCTGTFTPSGNGKFHPIACKRDNQAVVASVERAYYLNTRAGTASGSNLVTAGTPVSAAYVPGEWPYPFTGPDGNVYYLAEAGIAPAPAWDGVIRTDADWDLFAAILASGTDSFHGRTVVLDADIGVTNPAGTADHPFAGTFDGGGHTLTADISDTGRGAAPFRCIDGATISNLTVCGTVTSSGFHAAGLVGECVGTQPNTIADCVVAADIDASYAGGIVGHGGDNGTLTLERCVFSGGISGFGNFAGGLLGWCGPLTLTLGDCLCKGTFAPAGGKYHPIGCKWGDGTVTLDIERVYYLNTLVATVTGVQRIPGADGTPVSATYVQGEWNRPVTAADGLTYYRQPSGSYAEWTAETGIAGAWNEKDGDGVANVFRYAFDVTEGTDGMRILDLTFNDQGQVVVQTPPVVNSNGFGLSIATADDPAGTQNPTSHPLDSDGETIIDEPDTGSRTRFYRLKAAPGARYARSDE